MLGYPVITMGEKTHGGSKRNLLGETPDPALVELLSNEKQVSANTPPTFLFHTTEDTVVLPRIACSFTCLATKQSPANCISMKRETRRRTCGQGSDPEFLVRPARGLAASPRDFAQKIAGISMPALRSAVRRGGATSPKRRQMRYDADRKFVLARSSVFGDSPMKAVVTGATGFVGAYLLKHLQQATVLTRNPDKAAKKLPAGTNAVGWNPEKDPAPTSALNGADVVFHLAGEPVAEGRWSAAKKKAIRESRVAGTRHLVEGLEACTDRPKVLVSTRPSVTTAIGGTRS